jgi:hypothetical protein
MDDELPRSLDLIFCIARPTAVTDYARSNETLLLNTCRTLCSARGPAKTGASNQALMFPILFVELIKTRTAEGDGQRRPAFQNNEVVSRFREQRRTIADGSR